MDDLLSVITTYLDLVQEFSNDPQAFAAVLHPEVIQTEYPNQIFKTVQHRSFDEIIANIRVGREMLHQQSFEVFHTHVCPPATVIMEGRWRATTLNDAGPLLRGQTLVAELCLIFEFKDGKIYRQRRYPCYEPM